MKTLEYRLNSIPNAYFEFVDSVMEYANADQNHAALISNFLDSHPKASASDILWLISTQPDFFDDDIIDDESIMVS